MAKTTTQVLTQTLLELSRNRSLPAKLRLECVRLVLIMQGKISASGKDNKPISPEMAKLLGFTNE